MKLAIGVENDLFLAHVDDEYYVRYYDLDTLMFGVESFTEEVADQYYAVTDGTVQVYTVTAYALKLWTEFISIEKYKPDWQLDSVENIMADVVFDKTLHYRTGYGISSVYAYIEELLEYDTKLLNIDYKNRELCVCTKYFKYKFKITDMATFCKWRFME